MQMNSNIKKIYCFIQKELVCFFFKVPPRVKMWENINKALIPIF